MSTGKTEWSTWIELAFNSNGTLNTTALNKVPIGSGVYAIASKKSTGLYVTHYVGRSSRSIRERLQRHLCGNGNKVVASQLMLKRSIPSAPGNYICVAYLETKEPKIVEAAYLDTQDLPVCNLIRARLPPGISQALLWGAEFER
jgi:hypothetical protein